MSKFKENDFLNSNQIENSTDNNLLNSALYYAKLGCPVIPIHSIVIRNGNGQCTCVKGQECQNQGKHPRTRHGLADASNSEAQIRQWWTKHPNANVGLLTGKKSGFFVLDVDNKYGGNYSLLDLQELYQYDLGDNYTPFPETLIANTGSGGRHYFFKYPNDILIHGSVSEIGIGLDIRGESNYVVASPSNHKSGNNYSWFGVNTPILDAPDWLIYELISERDIDKRIYPNSLATNGEKIKEGGRHHKLWRYICGLVNSFSKDEVLKRALEKNNQCFEPPFPECDVAYQVNYLFNKYGKLNKTDLGLKK